MKFDWSLREEILTVTHRWPLVIIVFLIGCLIGWGISAILPSPYRAETTLSVAYNADAIARNPDDYKNWHMNQLNALAIAPDVLQETLNQLRQIDTYWESVSAEEFGETIGVHWRNTGIWRLTAESDTQEHALQAADIWTDTFLETYHAASSAAADANFLEAELYNQSRSLNQAKMRHAELTGIKDGIETWRNQVSALPEEQALDATNRWQLLSLVSRAACFDPAWTALLDQAPPAAAPLKDYLSWLDKVIPALETGIEALEIQIVTMESQLVETDEHKQQAFQESRGLSAKVFVERHSESPPTVTHVRESSISASIGGVLALLILLVIWMASITKKSIQRE